jgi:hypothetical protein
MDDGRKPWEIWMRQDPESSDRRLAIGNKSKIALGAGLGMIFGAALGGAAVGLVLGAAAGASAAALGARRR